jgi:predicted TIM-barrel fold metal-dependent hydrolase
LIASLESVGIGHEGNVYAELGSTWFLILRRPAEAAHVLGKLLKTVGPDRILWGTDSNWYGSPQPLIDAFRTFEIPQSFQDRFGYPPLTVETKEKILSHNARRVYSVSDRALSDAATSIGASRSWLGGASVELRRAIVADT